MGVVVLKNVVILRTVEGYIVVRGDYDCFAMARDEQQSTKCALTIFLLLVCFCRISNFEH
jgi:hypothetical protein